MGALQKKNCETIFFYFYTIIGDGNPNRNKSKTGELFDSRQGRQRRVNQCGLAKIALNQDADRPIKVSQQPSDTPKICYQQTVTSQ